jgi:hypothetical protein
MGRYWAESTTGPKVALGRKWPTRRDPVDLVVNLASWAPIGLRWAGALLATHLPRVGSKRSGEMSAASLGARRAPAPARCPGGDRAGCSSAFALGVLGLAATAHVSPCSNQTCTARRPVHRDDSAVSRARRRDTTASNVTASVKQQSEVVALGAAVRTAVARVCNHLHENIKARRSEHKSVRHNAE